MRAVAFLLMALLCSSCSRKRPSLWESLPLGTDAEFQDVWFADSLNGWIVGGSYQVTGGLVGRTRDGGNTWEYTSGIASQTPSSSRFSIEAAHFFDTRRGLATTDGGKIYATEDGGETWSLVRKGAGRVTISSTSTSSTNRTAMPPDSVGCSGPPMVERTGFPQWRADRKRSASTRTRSTS